VFYVRAYLVLSLFLRTWSDATKNIKPILISVSLIRFR